MRIEDGKFYITRAGAKIGPANSQPQSADWPWHIDGAGSFNDVGRFNGRHNHPLDLMAGADIHAGPEKTWRDVPVTMEFLAELFDAYCGADGHNLVVSVAAGRIGQHLT